MVVNSRATGWQNNAWKCFPGVPLSIELRLPVGTFIIVVFLLPRCYCSACITGLWAPQSSDMHWQSRYLRSVMTHHAF